MSKQNITIRRRYSTARREIFAAWTRPPLLRKWAFSRSRRTTKSVRVDLFPGGRFELIQRGGLDESRRWGRFREVQAPRRLIFSWASNDGTLAGAATRVTLELEGGESESTLTLVHEGLPDEASREASRREWEALLDSLATLVEAPSAGS